MPMMLFFIQPIELSKSMTMMLNCLLHYMLCESSNFAAKQYRYTTAFRRKDVTVVHLDEMKRSKHHDRFLLSWQWTYTSNKHR